MRYVLLGQTNDVEVKETTKSIAGTHVGDRQLNAGVKEATKTGKPVIVEAGHGAVKIIPE